jgi:hypothetical protein
MNGGFAWTGRQDSRPAGVRNHTFPAFQTGNAIPVLMRFLDANRYPLRSKTLQSRAITFSPPI